MSDEILPDLSNENNNSEEKKEIINNSEEKLPNPTVPELDDVQSFCAEFHIKVENAAGIRPWLQFSDTNFPGKRKRKLYIFKKKNTNNYFFYRRSFKTI
jgi:hypothetical protein